MIQYCVSAAAVVDFHGSVPIVNRLVALLRDLSGAGLAAPQIGISQRVVAVEVRKTDLFPDRPESPLYVMINPVIVQSDDSQEDGWEACFSVPGIMGIVPRATAIDLEHYTPNAERMTQHFEGYLARVVQHEPDHLDGINFLARVSTPFAAESQ